MEEYVTQLHIFGICLGNKYILNSNVQVSEIPIHIGKTDLFLIRYYTQLQSYAQLNSMKAHCCARLRLAVKFFHWSAQDKFYFVCLEYVWYVAQMVKVRKNIYFVFL